MINGIYIHSGIATMWPIILILMLQMIIAGCANVYRA